VRIALLTLTLQHPVVPPPLPVCAPAAVRIALLTFTSLGWRVPFRLHLLLQTINVGLLVGFGLHPYCASKVSWG